MSTQNAAEFWKALEAAEAKRRELSKVTHEMRAKQQARVSANDEPERTFAQIHEDGLRSVHAITRVAS